MCFFLFAFKNKEYLSGMKYDVKTTFCQICHCCVCLKEFFRSLSMFVRPITEQTKAHHKILEFLVTTFGMERSRHAVRVLEMTIADLL